MNKKIFLAFLMLSLIFSGSVWAKEVAIEALPATTAAKEPAAGIMVTGSGKVLARPGHIFTQGGHYEGVELPYLVSTPKPLTYPRWALREGWEGRISIAIEVLKDGSVGRTKVMQSTGHLILDEAATEAVKTWKFHPAYKNGQPIVECVQIPVTFKIFEE